MCLILPAQVLTFVPWEGRGGEKTSSKTSTSRKGKGRRSKGAEVGQKKKSGTVEKRRRNRRRQRKRGKKGGEGEELVDGDHGDDESDGK